MAAGAVVGRDAELATVADFLRDLARGRASLVIEGEPGIGKTTLWDAGIRKSTQRGFRVLSSRPGSSETRLTFVGLADFLSGVEEAVLEGIPPPQRRALGVALLREDPEGSAPEQRVVATAFLSVLRALAADSPVLVAVDDLQWLDLHRRTHRLRGFGPVRGSARRGPKGWCNAVIQINTKAGTIKNKRFLPRARFRSARGRR